MLCLGPKQVLIHLHAGQFLQHPLGDYLPRDATSQVGEGFAQIGCLELLDFLDFPTGFWGLTSGFPTGDHWGWQAYFIFALKPIQGLDFDLNWMCAGPCDSLRGHRSHELVSCHGSCWQPMLWQAGSCRDANALSFRCFSSFCDRKNMPKVNKAQAKTQRVNCFCSSHQFLLFRVSIDTSGREMILTNIKHLSWLHPHHEAFVPLW